jgi:hypothetical protein
MLFTRQKSKENRKKDYQNIFAFAKRKTPKTLILSGFSLICLRLKIRH